MFQSKIFKRIFFSYIAIILSCTAIYTAVAVYENYRMTSAQTAHANELMLSDIASSLNDKLRKAQSVVRNIRYNEVGQQMHLAHKMHRNLTSADLVELRRFLSDQVSSEGFDLYGAVIFLDGSTMAYTGSSEVTLPEAFLREDGKLPYLYNGSISNMLGIESDWYSFNRSNNLLYCDNFIYRFGSPEGMVCVQINMDALESRLQRELPEGYGFRLLYQGNEIWSVGEKTDRSIIQTASTNSDITYELYCGRVSLLAGNAVMGWLLTSLIIITVFYIWWAYWRSSKTYQPIDAMERMISGGSAGQADSMDEIVHQIGEIIGEKNRYQDRMITVQPYVTEGYFHSLVNGGARNDKVRLESDDQEIGLRYAFYIVSVVNFTAEDRNPAGRKAEEHEGIDRSVLESALKMVSENDWAEDQELTWYFRDPTNAYLVLGYNNQMEDSQAFFQKIRSDLGAVLDPMFIQVTMGVSASRDDLDGLRDACVEADHAMDGILHDGRGRVYFHEEDSENDASRYWLPDHLEEKLRKAVLSADDGPIHELLYQIYKTNMDQNGSTQMYRRLVEALHVSVYRMLQELTSLSTVHLTIERVQQQATLQEIFDYYDAALVQVRRVLAEHRQQEKSDEQLGSEIVAYVDGHYQDADLSLKTLQDEFHVSSKYLVMLFHNRFDMTYLQYLQNRRISHACEMLEQGEASLSEIAAACGYQSQLTFRRNFRNITGKNPSEYVRPDSPSAG